MQLPISPTSSSSESGLSTSEREKRKSQKERKVKQKMHKTNAELNECKSINSQHSGKRSTRFEDFTLLGSRSKYELSLLLPFIMDSTHFRDSVLKGWNQPYPLQLQFSFRYIPSVKMMTEDTEICVLKPIQFEYTTLYTLQCSLPADTNTNSKPSIVHHSAGYTLIFERICVAEASSVTLATYAGTSPQISLLTAEESEAITRKKEEEKKRELDEQKRRRKNAREDQKKKEEAEETMRKMVKDELQRLLREFKSVPLASAQSMGTESYEQQTVNTSDPIAPTTSHRKEKRRSKGTGPMVPVSIPVVERLPISSDLKILDHNMAEKDVQGSICPKCMSDVGPTDIVCKCKRKWHFKCLSEIEQGIVVRDSRYKQNIADHHHKELTMQQIISFNQAHPGLLPLSSLKEINDTLTTGKRSARMKPMSYEEQKINRRVKMSKSRSQAIPEHAKPEQWACSRCHCIVCKVGWDDVVAYGQCIHCKLYFHWPQCIPNANSCPQCNVLFNMPNDG